MQHERHDPDGDDFAEVWRSAHRRRSEDIYGWFTDIFKKRRRFGSPKYAGGLFRLFTHNREPLFRLETKQEALRGDGSQGGRSGQ
jgi:hypothetical protein